MEVAFDSKTVIGEDGQVTFDRVWFQDRVDMCMFSSQCDSVKGNRG